MKSFAVFAGLAPLAAAHWHLTYPAQRKLGNEETMGTFPCGGIDTVSTNRTQFPMSGAPIQMVMEHTQSNVEVFLAVGNEPGSAFNYIVVPTFDEMGPNNFCMGAGAIQWPSGLNITEGMNATLQVVTNGDGAGGLYNCADITFTSTPLSSADYSSNCQNSTGVTTKALSTKTNANDTTLGGSTASSSASGASSTSTMKAAAPQVSLASWGLAAVGVAAGILAM